MSHILSHIFVTLTSPYALTFNVGVGVGATVSLAMDIAFRIAATRRANRRLAAILSIKSAATDLPGDRQPKEV